MTAAMDAASTCWTCAWVLASWVRLLVDVDVVTKPVLNRSPVMSSTPCWLLTLALSTAIRAWSCR